MEELTLQTPRGPVACRWWDARSDRAAVLVGGVGGGWDTPANGLYPDLAATLERHGVSTLRVRFRNPRDLHEATQDVIHAIEELRRRGARRLALCGHSFGGAVAVRAAARARDVVTVVTLATQASGAEDASSLGPRCSILLVHGRDDTVLPPFSSMHVHGVARDPKRLVLLDGAGHNLDEVAREVREEVVAWLEAQLPPS